MILIKNSKTATLDSKSASLNSKSGALNSKTATLDSKTDLLNSKTASLNSKSASLDSKSGFDGFCGIFWWLRPLFYVDGWLSKVGRDVFFGWLLKIFC